MTTNEDNYKKFIEYSEYASAGVVADTLKVSEKTISRYKNKITEIPEHIILIIDLYRERNNDKKIIGNLNLEIIGIKQTIHNFKQSQERLFNI